MNEYELHHLAVLDRIARALETIALSNAPAPNFVKSIEAYSGFDFTSIGALVKGRDQNGPTELEWGGYSWTRRSPNNKFGEAIWFSRAIGKDAEGNVKYSRLITFKKMSEAEPLPRKVEALVEESRPASESKTNAKTAQPDSAESELDRYLGPRQHSNELIVQQPALTEIWPENEHTFVEWLKAKNINGKETRSALGTDARSWMKENGRGWSDVAKTISGTLGK
jgi:hypothetical protein